MKRIAVIGSGISGLAAAYYLSRKHEVHVFEKDTRIGGHTHTIVTESSQGPLPIDTGFIVHNDRNYPNFCRLMTELGVATGPSDMSFAVYSPSTGFEYSSRGARGYFAQRRNLLKPSHWNLFGEILRFNREAPKLLDSPDDISIQQFLDRGRYSLPFIERYLYPMASAVWSMAQEAIPAFPAVTMIRFFQNHGMLGVNTHPKWRVIRGGSHNYLPPLTKPFADRVYKETVIESVERSESRVTLRFRDRPQMEFDDVVFACHGNQILPLLKDPSTIEQDVLTNFTTTANETVLHRDSTLLPSRANARASWNYRLGEKGRLTMTYHMNRLQSLTVPDDYCVSLNADGDIAPSKIIRKMIYHHPLYTRAAIQAQERWHEISGVRRTHFCGAYWFYGFHEDGVNSALRVARALGAA